MLRVEDGGKPNRPRANGGSEAQLRLSIAAFVAAALALVLADAFTRAPERR
jgi:hypothetical protein